MEKLVDEGANTASLGNLIVTVIVTAYGLPKKGVYYRAGLIAKANVNYNKLSEVEEASSPCLSSPW